MKIVLIAALAATCLAGPALAQQPMGPGPGPGPGAVAVPAASKAEIVAAIRKAIAENYVLADKRAPLDAALAKGLKAGRYEVQDQGELIRRINDDLYAVAADKHLQLLFDPAGSAEMARRGSQRDDIEDTPFFKAMMRARNYGISEMKLLPGNVRYLRYDGFGWTGEESQKAIDAAMAFLRDGDAAILDLRTNGGGSPEAVKRITSYFAPAGTRLVTFHMRGATSDVSTSEAVPGGQMQLPLYVLTSNRAASAAEEFVSHVARLGFGTLVGETTAGAAYRNEHFPLPGGYVMSVSVGYPELPDGTNWEGKGVAPKIAVPADKALDRALQDAATALAAKAQGPRRTELEWAAALYAARVTAAAPARPLAAYAGRYGPRTVAVENGTLTWQRDGGIKSALVPLGGDLFMLEADPRSRMRFTGEGAVAGVTIERTDGSSTPSPKG
ncbi:S41 family peptidase [Sphingomonas sp. HITSZ_GF]|uniref:S41 family peptidase n=1 Tax=Sphingomonas sp. HITSZ_GF TaxID=3037247 RepID=UPI00240DDFCA|nr:S41 family peptidase [Sphingomonas sp. HITSZ_GF]MDG2533324.1 S41 family peptidase [Sphingomonas sp. HITSZ_GF]